MDTFDSMRPRTARGQARLRERLLRQKLQQLLEANDEDTFKAGLEKELGITAEHPKYAEMLKIWRSR